MEGERSGFDSPRLHRFGVGAWGTVAEGRASDVMLPGDYLQLALSSSKFSSYAPMQLAQKLLFGTPPSTWELAMFTVGELTGLKASP